MIEVLSAGNWRFLSENLLGSVILTRNRLTANSFKYIHTMKDTLGHKSIKTTEKYLHVTDVARKGPISPLDLLGI